eukprot:GHVS01107655.1.p1 GENE.GHVS01107655.1~~GHVS01107655.1.p1  ORF type:complete len:425 (+),score=43.12 GHVS01107655.1:35-1276(+)
MARFHSCKMEGYAFSTRLAVLAGMLLAVLLSCVVCPTGVASPKTSFIGEDAGGEASGEIICSRTVPPVIPVIPDIPELFLQLFRKAKSVAFRNYPQIDFVNDIVAAAFFMDANPEPYGDNFTLKSVNSWSSSSRVPVETSPSVPWFALFSSVHRYEGNQVPLMYVEEREVLDVVRGIKSVALDSKYIPLIDLTTFLYTQTQAPISDGVLRNDCSDFIELIGWPNDKASEYDDREYVYFIADYLLNKLSTHFSWISGNPVTYAECRQQFTNSVEDALEEFLPGKHLEITQKDRDRFNYLKKDSMDQLNVADNLATLVIDGKSVKVVTAVMDFDIYGIRLYETIREVLKAKEADFCILSRKNADGSVTLRVPAQYEKNNKQLWKYLEQVSKCDGTFVDDELTVKEEGWTNIEGVL